MAKLVKRNNVSFQLISINLSKKKGGTMNAKIALIGIIMAGLISGCEITNSEEKPKEFNPQVDGVWKFQAIVSIRCEDESGICDKYHDITYVYIDYPQFHACYERSDTYDGKLIKARKEDLEVAHKNQNIYKIKTDNGDTVSSDTLTIKMKKYESGAISIVKKTPDGEWLGHTYNYVGSFKISLPVAYQECRKNATYSKKTLYL